MFKEVLVPEVNDVTIHLPDALIGKRVEIIVHEQADIALKPLPVNRLTNNQFLEMIGILKDSSLTIETIKAKAWRNRV